jgi:hypothetical protein
MSKNYKGLEDESLDTEDTPYRENKSPIKNYPFEKAKIISDSER